MNTATKFIKNGQSYTAASVARMMAPAVDFKKPFKAQRIEAHYNLAQMAHEVGAYMETKEFFSIIKRAANR